MTYAMLIFRAERMTTGDSVASLTGRAKAVTNAPQRFDPELSDLADLRRTEGSEVSLRMNMATSVWMAAWYISKSISAALQESYHDGHGPECRPPSKAKSQFTCDNRT